MVHAHSRSNQRSGTSPRRLSDPPPIDWSMSPVSSHARLFPAEVGLAWAAFDRADVPDARKDHTGEALQEQVARAARRVGVRAMVRIVTRDACCPWARLCSRHGGDLESTDALVQTTMKKNSQGSISAALDAERPRIAALDGIAAGAVAYLTLAHDLAIATPQKRFLEVLTGRRLVVDGDEAFSPCPLVRMRKAKERVFPRDYWSTDKALGIGLCTQVAEEELKPIRSREEQGYCNAPGPQVPSGRSEQTVGI